MKRPLNFVEKHTKVFDSLNWATLLCVLLAVSPSLSESKANPKMASLGNLTTDQVVGDVIDSQPNSEVRVKYPSDVEVMQGNELKPKQVKDLPTFEFETKPDKLYTIMMVDPDAPSRAEPKLREILHYMVVNVPGSDVSKGDTLAEYIAARTHERTSSPPARPARQPACPHIHTLPGSARNKTLA